ncbi:hypothetical protein RclHR1_07400005 [Rhizophagus clarus]|uniref:Uncharacterized protein n=1 Tax=Rhizophagus clarus TaxID=94130 RepID=A0A2Z6RW89_9GLOM|nr:hypothetical protein RclHR1_07400005 [Rhizophagus clarus]
MKCCITSNLWCEKILRHSFYQIQIWRQDIHSTKIGSENEYVSPILPAKSHSRSHGRSQNYDKGNQGYNQVNWDNRMEI